LPAKTESAIVKESVRRGPTGGRGAFRREPLIATQLRCACLGSCGASDGCSRLVAVTRNPPTGWPLSGTQPPVDHHD